MKCSNACLQLLLLACIALPRLLQLFLQRSRLLGKLPLLLLQPAQRRVAPRLLFLIRLLLLLLLPLLVLGSGSVEPGQLVLK